MENVNSYETVEKAIDFLRLNFKSQPSLDEVAAAVNLSPFYFQKLFSDWAGVSPKKFLQYLTIGYAKERLRQPAVTLFDTAFDTGLTGTGRLHDLFMNIEGMTPGEYKNGGRDLVIHYSLADTPFGQIIIGSTQKGVCHMSFSANAEEALHDLQQNFPNAAYRSAVDDHQQNALAVFRSDWNHLKKVKLHLKGTPFQIKVWESLLKIPAGHLTTYSSIASSVSNTRAFRAVGSAVGDNPVAFLIPCHRVIRSTGDFGQYHWGSSRKTAMIGWEMSRVR